jgi:hypothetical protein
VRVWDGRWTACSIPSPRSKCPALDRRGEQTGGRAFWNVLLGAAVAIRANQDGNHNGRAAMESNLPMELAPPTITLAKDLLDGETDPYAE